MTTTNCGRSLSRGLHRVAIAIAASGVLVTSGSQANPSDTSVLVSPKDFTQLCAAGFRDSSPLDFVFRFGDEDTPIRFPQVHGETVLGLHDESVPKLKSVEGLKWQGWMPLGNDRLSLTTQGTRTDQDRDDQIMEPWTPEQLDRLFDVKKAGAEKTNGEGTTCLLSERSSYLIRRPDAEWSHRSMEIAPN